MVAMTKAELAVFEEVSGDDNLQALSSDEDAEVIRPSKSSQIIPPQTVDFHIQNTKTTGADVPVYQNQAPGPLEIMK